jgi:hypothetical protein
LQDQDRFRRTRGSNAPQKGFDQGHRAGMHPQHVGTPARGIKRKVDPPSQRRQKGLGHTYLPEANIFPGQAGPIHPAAPTSQH